MKKSIFIATSLLLIAGMTSCTHRIADLTIASTKNMNIAHPQGYRTATNQRVEGEDKKHIIILFPTGIPNMKEAIDRAIERSGSKCVGLSNATIYRKGWYIPFIYGQESYVVEGDPIYTK